MSGAVAYTNGDLNGDDPGRILLISNFLMYIGVLLVGVSGGANSSSNLGVMAAFLAVAWHLNVAVRPQREVAVVLITGLIGSIWETLLIGSQWINYQDQPLEMLPPAWVAAQWMVLGTTFNVSLHWLKDRVWLSACLGGLGGAGIFWLTDQGGALALLEGRFSIALNGLGWALLTPLLSIVAAWVASNGLNQCTYRPYFDHKHEFSERI